MSAEALYGDSKHKLAQSTKIFRIHISIVDNFLGEPLFESLVRTGCSHCALQDVQLAFSQEKHLKREVWNDRRAGHNKTEAIPLVYAH